jgi:hypothetical protein
VSEVRKTSEPHDRLTRLCAVMTGALDDMLEMERKEARFLSAKERAEYQAQGKVRCIIFLADDKKGGIVIHDYDDAMEAMAELFVHMQAIFRANGKSLDLIGIPESPEGVL